ncbi:hypothetical protein NSPZN2_10516 [Nitrospira defluvii]|uniref:Uncharacterized protein n=1 Tax=Nitrospira defluvii TaxID=330214 RepID=A0ABM8QHY1_9BACT|nr:hypothetical protein NSPZN2_10516 [Nitrospira defluvii]
MTLRASYHLTHTLEGLLITPAKDQAGIDPAETE